VMGRARPRPITCRCGLAVQHSGRDLHQPRRHSLVGQLIEDHRHSNSQLQAYCRKLQVDVGEALEQHGLQAISRNRPQEVGRMRLTLVAKDPDSVPDGSPTLYRTDRGSWIVQGWKVTDPEALAVMDVPEGETCVEIPDRMIPFFQNR
jgi:hypothetical protein